MAAVFSCSPGDEAAEEVGAAAEDEYAAEIAPGILPPEVRFAVAPEVGALFPDITIVDDEGAPIGIRELAKRKPYTVLTLGCLT